MKGAELTRAEKIRKLVSVLERAGQAKQTVYFDSLAAEFDRVYGTTRRTFREYVDTAIQTRQAVEGEVDGQKALWHVKYAPAEVKKLSKVPPLTDYLGGGN